MMEVNILDILNKISIMDLEELYILHYKFTKEIGPKIKLKEQVYLLIKMGQNILENGRKIYRMEKVFNNGNKVLNMKECIRMVLSKEKEYLNGQMDLYIKG